MSPGQRSSNSGFFQDFKRAGISRLLKEKGREQFWPKKGNLRRTRKNLKIGQKISLLSGSTKCFPLSFNTFKRDFS
jgi:hypothetical protein